MRGKKTRKGRIARGCMEQMSPTPQRDAITITREIPRVAKYPPLCRTRRNRVPHRDAEAMRTERKKLMGPLLQGEEKIDQIKKKETEREKGDAEKFAGLSNK